MGIKGYISSDIYIYRYLKYSFKITIERMEKMSNLHQEFKI